MLIRSSPTCDIEEDLLQALRLDGAQAKARELATPLTHPPSLLGMVLQPVDRVGERDGVFGGDGDARPARSSRRTDSPAAERMTGLPAAMQSIIFDGTN